MSTLFLMAFLASFPAAIAGLINPRWVLPKFVKNPTRKLATQVYAVGGGFSLLFAMWIAITTTTPAADITATNSSSSQTVPAAAPAVAPKAIASPTPSPIAVIKTIGVSRAAIQSTFEKPEVGFTFETSSSRDGLPVAIGKSPDGETEMRLVGQPENLSRASLNLFILPNNQPSNDRNAIYSAGFLELAVPGSSTWLKESLPRLVNDESEISTVQSGKVITVIFTREVGLVEISVEPEG